MAVEFYWLCTGGEHQMQLCVWTENMLSNTSSLVYLDEGSDVCSQPQQFHYYTWVRRNFEMQKKQI